MVLLVILSVNASAQSLFFSTLSTRDGLPSNTISAFTQDRYHFIWVGTANGLARYDGNGFRIFTREENEHSLPANEISSLLVDDDFVWVGTWRGLCKINVRNFQITRINLKENTVIRTLYKDKQRNIWIGTSNGLIRLSSTDNTFKHYTTENSALSHNTIRTIHQDMNGNLWVGTYNKLNKLNSNTGVFETIDLKGNYKPELKNNLICDIKPVQHADSLLWIGTETGLCLLNTITHTYTHYKSDNTKFSNEVIKNIYTGADGNLWLGTDFGLNLFDPKTKEITSYFHNPQVSYSIANNVIWVVTSNGLSIINKYNHLFTYHEVNHKIGDKTVGNQVKAILVSKKNILWIATIHGVIRLDQKKNTQKIFDIESASSDRLLLNNVFALEEDEQERIWIGTAAGINVWDEKKQMMQAVTANAENGLTSNYIAKFIKGADGSFWVSAWEGGLFKVVSGFDNLNAIRFEFVGDFASEKNTYALNALWGVNANELYRIDLSSYVSKKVHAFNVLAKGKDIYSPYYSTKGSLWAGTLNGLIEYKPSIDSAIFHPIVTGNDIDLNNIISDHSGNIWAAADKFVLKFSPGENKTEIFPLDKDIPLKTFYTNCSAKSTTGDLIFGGDNGYITFPTDIKPNLYQPDVLITSLELNNKIVLPNQEMNDKVILIEDISFTKELILDYAHRSVTFEFSSLHYWQPEINVYAYKLEGFDDDWKYVSGLKNFAVYSNLSPGTYTLHVKGTNNYGVWSDKIASVKIIVDPPLFFKSCVYFYVCNPGASHHYHFASDLYSPYQT
jgi:ligand-binding sensor domain-containing protein